MNSKVSIAFFTRTPWNEMPRIRHQLANLLASNGHHITFFEKGDSPDSRKISDNITVISLPEVIHHQLRPLKSIGDTANNFPKNFIKKYYVDKPSPDIVINFNYDFGFLKEIFPAVPLITFINDDFIAQAKPWMKKAITARLAETCSISDEVLTVSYPLLRQLQKHNKNSHLFLPWAEKKYSEPTIGKERNVVLYFGYINHRVDFNVLKEIAEAKIPLRLIGPVQRTVDKIALEKLLLHKNVSLLPAQFISKIDFSDICCSIMPYDAKVESVNACSISNRAFNLLSYGILLLQPAFPEVVPASDKIIRYCRTAEDYLKGIEYFKNNFVDSQDEIQKFLSGNYSEDRYEFLQSIFDRLITKNNEVETVNSGY
jgi:hypothetical protein